MMHGMQIDVVLFDGWDELDALAPYEVFSTAGADVALVTLEGARPVTGAHGATVQATGPLREGTDVVLVPGGGWNTRAPAGALAQARNPVMRDAITAAHRRGAIVAGVCTGGMILAAAGVLEGRAAVTHADGIQELRDDGVDVRPEARVVDAGDIVTCGGVTAGLDLALHLVQRECGPQVADRVAREIEHDRRGPVVTSAPDA